MCEAAHNAMIHSQTPKGEKSFSKSLLDIAGSIPPEGLTLRNVMEKVGSRGLLPLCMILTIPFLLPISLPGSSLPFGLLIALIGFGRLFDRPPWLPARFLDRRLTATQAETLLGKGARFFANLTGIDFKGAYENIADTPDVNVFSPLVEMIEESMHSGAVGSVKLIYTQFISSLSQKATSFSLLPIDLSQLNDTEKNQPVKERSEMVYELEPDVGDVLDEAIRLYFEAKLMQARVESAASEHAMRMVAMGNANRNASDLIDDLTLELNATRQAAITQEIAEITGGASAIAK